MTAYEPRPERYQRKRDAGPTVAGMVALILLCAALMQCDGAPAHAANFIIANEQGGVIATCETPTQIDPDAVGMVCVTPTRIFASGFE